MRGPERPTINGDGVGLLLEEIAASRPLQRADLRKLKVRVASRTNAPLIRNDVLLDRYRREVAEGLRRPDQELERILRLNGIRSQSGIATVTVITEPFACPGRCVYCPTEARAPKSYLINEPAVMRALRNDYDPYRQVRSRLEALDETGHPTDKTELIVKGGTWSFYPQAYQREFIRRCVDAANDFMAHGARLARQGSHQKRTGEARGHAPGRPEADGRGLATLCEAQQRNETAACRIIGVTIETRPDYIDEAEIRRLRELGVTRVELGVQTLDESVLEGIVRDHGTAQIRSATQWLKDAGVKVAYHLMPNLPGAEPRGDLDTARRTFEDPGYRPDALKLYPCVVIETAELHRWWVEGRYHPYDGDTLLELLVDIKRLIPPYVRIERIVRDIPSTSIRAGCAVTNLREAVQRRMRARGWRCRCIRCRQVRSDATGDFRLTRRDYEASNGLEVFLSFEDASTERLASLLRLRVPAPARRRQGHWLPILEGAGLVRELHSYGEHLPLHDRSPGAVQHHGFGRRLLEEAERIAREEFGLRRMAVIAGVGVREYYRRLGYALQDTYMVKALDGL